MEKAGLAAAEIARDKLLTDGREKVLVLAGPGNNGGDAFVAARHLRAWWYKVTLVFTGERAIFPTMQDGHWMPGSRRTAKLLTDIHRTKKWDAVIDGLFGIGLDHGREGDAI